MMKNLFVRLGSSTLFLKLLLSFVCVIFILISFTYYAFSLSTNNLQREIVRNTSINLSNAVDRYENHFNILRNAVYQLMFDDKVTLLEELGHSMQFSPVNQIIEDINAIANNELMYVDNLVLQFQKNDYNIDKYGPSDVAQLFTHTYFSDAYGPDFWRGQFKEHFLVRIFPQAVFTDFNSLKSSSQPSHLIPVIYKTSVYNQFYAVAFLDARKLSQAFLNDGQGDFYIFNDEGKLIYGSFADRPETQLLAELKETGEHYFERDSRYYFTSRGDVSGLTYVHRIEANQVANQMSQLNRLLLTLLVAAIAISIALSILLSLKFSSPVKKIINAILKTTPAEAHRGDTNEFNFIYESINQFAQADRHLRGDLQKTSAQLRYLNYMRKAKSIYAGSDHEDEDSNQPFYLILFHLTKTQAFYMLKSAEQNRAMYYLKELFHSIIADYFDDLVTIQIEKDQILTLIFTNKESPDLPGIIERLQHIFYPNREYGYLTVALHTELRSASELTATYEEALEKIHRRKLAADTQIIADMPPLPLNVGFTPAQEQEFMLQLQAGQHKNVTSIVTQQLGRMDKAGATVNQFSEFAKETIAKTVKCILALGLDISPLFEAESPYVKIRECATLSDYSDFFDGFLFAGIQIIADKKESDDPMRRSLLEYIDRYYNKDISLEKVSSELGLSIHYISKYFKEKMGMNFIDYLLELRVDKAKALLTDSELQIQEIAEEVGYLNTNSFIRMFRKYTGVSPGEYRKQRVESS